MNGIGFWWFPDWLRALLTKFGSAFFIEASWDKHDEGYDAGHPSRAECDRKFLQAMLRDASITPTARKAASCCIIAWVFWLMVRLFGWASYNSKGTPK